MLMLKVTVLAIFTEIYSLRLNDVHDTKFVYTGQSFIQF